MKHRLILFLSFFIGPFAYTQQADFSEVTLNGKVSSYQVWTFDRYAHNKVKEPQMAEFASFDSSGRLVSRKTYPTPGDENLMAQDRIVMYGNKETHYHCVCKNLDEFIAKFIVSLNTAADRETGQAVNENSVTVKTKNARGLVVSEEFYNDNGERQIVVRYTYDAKKQLIREEDYFADTLWKTTINTYDAKGLLTGMSWIMAGQTYREINEYNGTALKAMKAYRNDKLVTQVEYYETETMVKSISRKVTFRKDMLDNKTYPVRELYQNDKGQEIKYIDYLPEPDGTIRIFEIRETSYFPSGRKRESRFYDEDSLLAKKITYVDDDFNNWDSWHVFYLDSDENDSDSDPVRRLRSYYLTAVYFKQ